MSSGPCLSPAEAFNAEAAGIFGGILAIIIAMVFFGAVLVILFAILSVVLIIASIFFLTKKAYGAALVCFLVGVIGLPMSIGIIGAINELKKNHDFRMNTQLITQANGMMYYKLDSGQIVSAKTMYDAAMGKGHILTDSERDNLARIRLKGYAKSKGATCRINISKRRLDIYFPANSSQYSLEPTYLEMIGISGYYQFFQDCLGISRLEPVRVRIYKGGNLIARTGKLAFWDDSDKYFDRTEFKVETTIYGEKHYFYDAVSNRKRDAR